jgi:hypothetical protein
MWAVAAQPQAGFTPMIPTPSFKSGMAHAQAFSIRKTGVRGVSSCASSSVPVAFSRPR